MTVEQYYFRHLNVSLWQTSHFLGMLAGFHTSSIDARTKKPFLADPLQPQMSLFRKPPTALPALKACVYIFFFGSNDRDNQHPQLLLVF